MAIKRLRILLVMCSLAIGCLAQTQQGVVKTKGRMVNGKHVAGQGLSGATVTIQGRNAVQSQTNGGFSFPIPNKTFMLQGVQKNGYQLVDPDATRKAYQYSPNPFYIVMETPDQQSEDKLAAERKIRRTLQRQLQQREDELEELKAQNKLTQEEYRKAMQQLYNDQQNNEKLIADMAKEYAEMDYDQMDELNRQISDAILNGELTKADSLLRSKGDMNSRIAEVRKAQRAEAQEEAELAQRQENLAASKEGTKKKLDDLAQDCKNYFERFKMANQHDSAAYYIELRAELDTTNADWQYDAAYYLQKQNQYRKAQVFYERTQRLVVSNPKAYEPAVATILQNLALLYSDTQRFTEAEKMYLSALEICQRLAVSNPEAYEPDVAMTQNNLASLYYKTQRYAEAEKMYLSVLKICHRLAASNPEVYEPHLASAQHNLALLYSHTQRFAEAEKAYLSALEIRQRLAASNPETYEPDMAATQNNLAGLYYNTQRFAEAEKMFLSALEIRQRLAVSNPEVYEPDVADTQQNLALLYSDVQRFAEAEKIYLSALEIRQRLVVPNPEAYEPDVAMTLNNLANLYYKTQRFSDAETMYKEVLDIRHRLAQTNPQAHEPDVAGTLNNLACLYVDTQRFSESELMYKEALEICRRLAQENPQAYESDVAMTLNNLANLYYKTQRFSDAEAMCKEALAIRRRLAQSNPQAYESNVAMTLHNLAVLYKDTQRFSESESMCKEALAIRRRLAQENPQAYEPAVAITLNNLARLYSDTQRFSESEVMYKESLEIYRRLKQSHSQVYEPDVAYTLHNLAILYKNTQRFSESETMYKKALEIYRRLAQENPQAYEPTVARTLNNLAILYKNTQRSAELESVYKELRQLYTQKTNREYKQGLKESAEKSYIDVVVNNKRLIDLNFEAHIYDYIQSLSTYVLLAAENKHFLEAYQTNKSYFLPYYKKLLEINPEDYRERYSKKVGAQAFYAIFVKQYSEAEQYAREGLQVDSTQHWIASNLAAALLFQGKYAEAEQVYRQYNEELKESFLDDFKQYAEAGVIPKGYEVDVEKIKRLLNE